MCIPLAADPQKDRQATKICWAARVPTSRKCVPWEPPYRPASPSAPSAAPLITPTVASSPTELTDQVLAALKKTETIMGMKYGEAANPLLLSCRSGARSSMPGMMDTVLNVGLCTATIPGMIAKSNNPRFVWDSYRRLIMMYADVVMEKAEGLEPALGKGIRKILDEKLDKTKHAKGYASDTDLSADDLKTLAAEFKALVEKHLGKPFPDDPMATALGRHRSRVQELERQKGRLLPPDRRNSRRMGNGGQRPGDGVRQHGRLVSHRRRFHSRPGHGRQQILRRMARECPG